MEEVVVFENYTEGFEHLYPAALAGIDQGTILAFVEAKKLDDAPRFVLVRRSADGGRTWGPLQEISQSDETFSIGNVCPFVDRQTGTIWLAFCGRRPDRFEDTVYVTHSKDDGVNWSGSQQRAFATSNEGRTVICNGHNRRNIMKQEKLPLAVFCGALVLLPAADVVAQDRFDGNFAGGDVLNEVPLWPVPSEMTLKEYRDANRRLNVGRLLMSVPLPGALHFYADESREGWMHVGAAVLGGVSFIVGAAMMDDKENAWEKTKFEIEEVVNELGDVKRYKKIPVTVENGEKTYRLEQINRKQRGGGGPLIVMGAGLFFGQMLHDWIDGIKTIERKRDAVRFKYGKMVGYSMRLDPNLEMESGTVGAKLSLRF